MLMKMAGEKRLVSRRDELQARFVSCFENHAGRLCAAGGADEVVKQTEVYVKQLPDRVALTLSGRVLRVLLKGGARRQAGQIPGLIERILPDSVERRGELCEGRMALLIADGMIKEAQVLYQGELATIPDATAMRGLESLAVVLPDGGEALSEAVIDASASRKGVRESAARLWINVAVKRGSGADVGRRLVAIRKKGLTDTFVMGQIDKTYRVLLNNPVAEVLVPVYDMCKVMSDGSMDQGWRRRCSGYLLDMGYFLEKYDEALELVKGGALGENNEQTEMFLCKIKGHKALKEGRFDDAVGHFREFMTFVGKKPGVREMDPLDGAWVSTDMILALNAKRIGDVLVKAGKAKEAAAAYAEARGYYEKALKEFPDAASKENQKVRKQMGEIPAA